jgi:hypothetical protein
MSGSGGATELFDMAFLHHHPPVADEADMRTYEPDDLAVPAAELQSPENQC